jgi:lipid-A-disaccharide synthase
MKVFIVAGEPSGDLLGAALMAGLKQLQPAVTFAGVGGCEMQGEGLNSQFPMQELSVMGLAEVLPKYAQLKRRISETAKAAIDFDPDVLITIDSPDFSFRVAKLVKQGSNIRTVHYVAPSVWAWRPKRAAKMAKVIDHVLALLPFEPDYMTAEGMDCDFVGHPITTKDQATAAEIQEFRTTSGIGDHRYMVVLPGSRKSEVTRLAPIFGAAVAKMAEAHPDLRFVLPAAGPVVSHVQQATDSWPVKPLILDPTNDVDGVNKRAAIAGAELALAASGTVSLELAAAQTPMVIAYTFNWLTLQIMKRMIRIDTVTLVNLVSDTRTVPECLGAACTASNIVTQMEAVLADPSAQEKAMNTTMDLLGRGQEPPGLRAAHAVLSRLRN